MKRTISLWLTAILMLVLAACNGNSAAIPAEPPAPASPVPVSAQTDGQTPEPTETEITHYAVTTATSKISGEIHRIAGSDPTTVIIVVGGSSARTRTDTAVAVPLFLDAQTAMIGRATARPKGNTRGPTPNIRSGLFPLWLPVFPPSQPI